ncbi:arginase family protein [Candidatus Woesearchaeota archaeon]|nr:MAG: arginase family protein [Candidatus Woesearchaeota archaeon]
MKILKIPFSAGGLGKTKGCELAPDAIENEVKNFFLTESGVLPVFDSSQLKINQSNIEATNKSVGEAIKNVNEPAIILGGDHSITYAAFSAFAKKYSSPGIVVFDAHFDCQSDMEPPTHEDYLRMLIRKGVVSPQNVVVIGTRNWHKDELEFVKEQRIKHFSMKEISFEGIREVCDAAMSIAKNWDAIYLSVDIDVLDPSFAPGTGYQEPGGMSSRELIYFLQRFKNLRKLEMIDIVEVNPKKDVNNITVKTAAKIVVEMS